MVDSGARYSAGDLVLQNESRSSGALEPQIFTQKGRFRVRKVRVTSYLKGFRFLPSLVGDIIYQGQWTRQLKSGFKGFNLKFFCLPTLEIPVLDSAVSSELDKTKHSIADSSRPHPRTALSQSIEVLASASMTVSKPTPYRMSLGGAKIAVAEDAREIDVGVEFARWDPALDERGGLPRKLVDGTPVPSRPVTIPSRCVC